MVFWDDDETQENIEEKDEGIQQKELELKCQIFLTQLGKATQSTTRNGYYVDVNPRTLIHNTFKAWNCLLYIITVLFGFCLWWMICRQVRVHLPTPWFRYSDGLHVQHIHRTFVSHICFQNSTAQFLDQAIGFVQTRFPLPLEYTNESVLIEKMLIEGICATNVSRFIVHRVQQHCSNGIRLQTQEIYDLLRSVQLCFAQKLQSNSLSTSPYILVLDWSADPFKTNRSIYVSESNAGFLNAPNSIQSVNKTFWEDAVMLSEIWFHMDTDAQNSIKRLLKPQIHFYFSLFSEPHARRLSWDFPKDIQMSRLRLFFEKLPRVLNLQIFSHVIQDIHLEDSFLTYTMAEFSEKKNSLHKLAFSQTLWNVFQEFTMNKLWTLSSNIGTYHFGLCLPLLEYRNSSGPRLQWTGNNISAKSFAHPKHGILVFPPFPSEHEVGVVLSKANEGLTIPSTSQLDSAAQYWVGYIRTLLGLPKSRVLSSSIRQRYTCQDRVDPGMSYDIIDCMTMPNSINDKNRVISIIAEIQRDTGLAEWELRKLERHMLNISFTTVLEDLAKVYDVYRDVLFDRVPHSVTHEVQRVLSLLHSAYQSQDSYSRRFKWVHLAHSIVVKCLEEYLVTSYTPRPLSHKVALYAPILIPVGVTFLFLSSTCCWNHQEIVKFLSGSFFWLGLRKYQTMTKNLCDGEETNKIKKD